MSSLHDEPDNMSLPPALDETNSPVEDCDWWQTAPLPGDRKASSTVDIPRPFTIVDVKASASVVRGTGGLHGHAHAADLWGPLLADILHTASEDPAGLRRVGRETRLSAHAHEFIPASARPLNANAPAFTLKKAQEASEKKRRKHNLNSAVPLPSIRLQRSLEEEMPIVQVWKWWRILRAADLSRAGETLAVCA